MTKARKLPTSTCLVFEELQRVDDFRTARQLQRSLSLDSCHVSAALYHLRKYSAVDCMVAASRLWWFATPNDDTRSRRVDERRPELRARKPRRSNGRAKAPR